MSTQILSTTYKPTSLKKKKKKKKIIYLISSDLLSMSCQSTMLGIFMVFNIFMILIQINSNIWG